LFLHKSFFSFYLLIEVFLLCQQRFQRCLWYLDDLFDLNLLRMARLLRIRKTGQLHIILVLSDFSFWMRRFASALFLDMWRCSLDFENYFWIRRFLFEHPEPLRLVLRFLLLRRVFLVVVELFNFGEFSFIQRSLLFKLLLFNVNHRIFNYRYLNLWHLRRWLRGFGNEMDRMIIQGQVATTWTVVLLR
jgi:hypothetical protein